MDERPVKGAYYALVYNPFGKRREDYSWPFPARWFDIRRDECVLVGEEFWDFVGGEGTYQFLIDEINKLGVAYKERIYRQYLGVEPPEGFDKVILE